MLNLLSQDKREASRPPSSDPPHREGVTEVAIITMGFLLVIIAVACTLQSLSVS